MWGKINLYKPEEMSSQQAVTGLRRILGIKKIGHSGTLDPMATGVLNCFVGKATRFIDLLPEDEKVYRAKFILGKTSDTLDIWGRVEDRSFEAPDRKSLEEALAGFLGESYQKPPMYSAIKYRGKALYKYAREGQEVERKKRRIYISRLELLDYDGASGVLEIACSRGTYIRSLIDDLGDVLGTGALMSGLVRESNDWASLDETYSLEDIEEMYKRGDSSFLVAVDKNIDLPKVTLSDDEYFDLALGRIKVIERNCSQGRHLLYFRGGFVGTALCDRDSLIKEKVVQVDYGS